MFASFMCAGYHFHIQIDWYRSLISFSNRRHTYSKKERQVACKTAIEIPFHHHRVSLCNTLTMPKFSKQTDVTTMLGISILFFSVALNWTHYPCLKSKCNHQLILFHSVCIYRTYLEGCAITLTILKRRKSYSYTNRKLFFNDSHLQW